MIVVELHLDQLSVYLAFLDPVSLQLAEKCEKVAKFSANRVVQAPVLSPTSVDERGPPATPEAQGRPQGGLTDSVRLLL